MDEQAERLESRLDSLVGEGGTRGPPASSLPLAETLGDLERLQMTEDQVGEAKDLFDLYDADASGTIDNDELMSVLRLLGEHPTSEEVDAMIAEVDENKNGDLTLNEFLTVYAVTVQKHVEEDCVDPSDPSSPRTRSETAKRKLNTVSFYGVHALMRWVKHDGDKVGGDVTGLGVPAPRRMTRVLLVSKPVELVFYFCIVLSAINSGLQTCPEVRVLRSGGAAGPLYQLHVLRGVHAQACGRQQLLRLPARFHEGSLERV